MISTYCDISPDLILIQSSVYLSINLSFNEIKFKIKFK